MSFPQACIQYLKVFGTDLGWEVDEILNQPCEVAEKSLEGRNKFFKTKIKIVSVKTIFAFFDCDSQGFILHVRKA